MKTRPTKVLHVAETIKGGISTFLNTVETSCRPELENRYLVPSEHCDQLAPGLSAATFSRPRRGGGPARALAMLAEREARDWQPDVLWFHSTFSLGALAWLRLKRLPGKYIYTAHGWSQMRETGLRRALLALVERELTRMPDLILNISEHDRILAGQSGYRGNHIVVENAMGDLPPRLTPEFAARGDGVNPFAATADRLNLLFVGRCDRQKGLDLLLPAFQAALAENPRLHLHVVGAGVNGDAALPPVDPAHVTFHAWVPAERIPAYYASADLVVMPSRWEGLPMVLIEALRAGRPVLVSDVCGLPGLISEGESGLVMPLDRPGMTRALSALDPDRLTAMRLPARALFETRYAAPRFRSQILAAVHALTGIETAPANAPVRDPAPAARLSEPGRF